MALRATLAAGWPLRNLYNMATAADKPPTAPDERGSFSGGRLRPVHNQLADYVGVQFSALPKILIAVLCWRYTVDMRAASLGYDFSPGGWVARIVLRDVVLCMGVAGVWDYILYFSPLKQRLTPYKFNKDYPGAQQLSRDAFWTFSATLLASVQECVLMRWWAGGHFKHAVFGAAPPGEQAVPWDTSFFGTDNTTNVFSTPELPLLGTVHFHEFTLCFILWTVTMLYWRIAHFYLIHRAMHPWFSRTGGLHNGDVGAFLYRWVHAHHHQSYNPTAFSGFSMTPVESTLYISAALIPLLFRHGAHPWLHLYTKLDLIIGAQIGHDGFDAPGGGSYFHQLHHAHYDCNYGDAAFPLDWMFGSFEDGSKWATQKQGEKKAE